MKKITLLIALFFVLQVISAQNVVDLTNSKSVERTHILNALRGTIKTELKQDVKFIVGHLKVKGTHAFLKGELKTTDGKDIDFSKTIYKEAVEEDAFDGGTISALLKKVKGKWQYIVHVIGPTDLPWGCWWKDYKAPKQIFDYTEEHCDW